MTATISSIPAYRPPKLPPPPPPPENPPPLEKPLLPELVLGGGTNDAAAVPVKVDNALPRAAALNTPLVPLYQSGVVSTVP